MKVLTANETALSIALTPVTDGAPLHGNGSAAALEIGAVSYAGAHHPNNVVVEQKTNSYVVTTKFGLTVSDPAEKAGTASITACLVYPSRFTIRIDGMKIEAMPRLILAHVPIGRVSIHRIDVEVPNDVPAESSAVVNHPIQFAAIPE